MQFSMLAPGQDKGKDMVECIGIRISDSIDHPVIDGKGHFLKNTVSLELDPASA